MVGDGGDYDTYTHNGEDGVLDSVEVQSGGTFHNGDTIGGDVTVCGNGTFNNTGTLYGGAMVNGGTLNNDIFLYGGVTVSGGKFDTAEYTGWVQGFTFDGTGDLSFTVTEALVYTLNSWGEVNLSGGNIFVNFDDTFAASDWVSFDLENLFRFNHPDFMDTGSFASDEWYNADQWTIDGLGTQGTDWHFVNSMIVKGPDSPSGVPEPATLLVLGLGLGALPLAKRFRKKA